MSAEDGFDDMLAALAALPTHDAGAARTRRTRERCLAQLASRRRRPIVSLGAARVPGWLEPAAAVGVSSAYLAAAVQLSVVFLQTMR